MKSFSIQGKKIDIDESKKYYEYYIENGCGKLVNVNFEKILTILQDDFEKSQNAKEYLILLKRWIIEAPRKRKVRELIRKGMHALTNEYFFQNEENGEEYIEGLENSGKFAEYLLKEIWNFEGMPETSYRTVDDADATIGLIIQKK